MLSKTQLTDQLALQDRMNTIVNPGWLKANYPWHRAIMVEAVEALDHFGWKWWKKSEPDLPQVRIELVDIWHFHLSATLVSADGDYQLATAYIQSGFRDAAHVDTLHLFSMLVAAAGEGYFATSIFAALMRHVDFSWDQLHVTYMAKNVLNIFRQNHGYKEGTYVKFWMGVEDNVVLDDLLKAHPDATVEQLTEKLETIYAQVTA